MNEINDKILDEIFLGDGLEISEKPISKNVLPAKVESNLTCEEILFDDSDEDKEKLNNERKQIREEEKRVLETSNTLLKHASDLALTEESADNINAATGLVKAVTSMISEINKGIRQRERHLMNMELERQKMQHRSELIKLRNNISNPDQTVNGDVIQNNNYFNYKQEDLVKQIIEQQNS